MWDYQLLTTRFADGADPVERVLFCHGRKLPVGIEGKDVAVVRYNLAPVRHDRSVGIRALENWLAGRHIAR